MTDAPISKDQRDFCCRHCKGTIRISKTLPPTTGPCPHCSGIITSPALESAESVPLAIAPTSIQETPPLAPALSPLPVTAPHVLEIPAVPTENPPRRSERSDLLEAPAIPSVQNPEPTKSSTPTPASTVSPKERTSELHSEPIVEIAEEPPRSGVIMFMLVLLALAVILFGVAYLIFREIGL